MAPTTAVDLTGIADAVAGEDGLPGLARAIGRALGAGIAIHDDAGTVLAVAARSSDDERALLAGDRGVEQIDLVAAGATAGTIRIRRPSSAPDVAADAMALIYALVASELVRYQGPVHASAQAAAAFLHAVIDDAVGDPDELERSAAALGVVVERGVSILLVRARTSAIAPDGWRQRVVAAAARGARAASTGALAAESARAGLPYAEVVLLLPGGSEADAARGTETVLRELRTALDGHSFAIGRSRIARCAPELTRAAHEATLATNVAEGEAPDEDGDRVLAFEDTGAYRLLLPAMSEDPDELRRFYDETVAPLVAYDEQYESHLVQTVVTFLAADGNVAGTAQRLFTHRHTIRYRLERARELSGLDVGSTDGRERLSLGLKAMRVLGLPAPGESAGFDAPDSVIWRRV